MYCRRGRVPNRADYRGVKLRHLPALNSKQFETLSHGLVSSVAARVARHDVVFTVNIANALYCAAAKLTGQRLVLNTDGQEWLRTKWSPPARGFFKLSAKIAGRATTALVCDCRAMSDIYATEFRAASSVIPYCWTQLDPAPSNRHVIDVEPRGYFLVAARLVPENNVDRVVEAYTRSSIELPLVVMGAANYSSPAEEAIRNLASRDNRILVAGHVEDRSEFASLVAAARVYIHAHEVGGINPSLVEALGVGARIVALDTPFNREAAGECASYFSGFDEDLLATLTDVIAEEPGHSQARRDAGKKRALTRFSLESVTDAHERLFRAAAGSGSRSGVVIDTEW